MRQHLVAVDVGTGSARAGVFDRSGLILSRATHPIVMQKPMENHAEHDSEDIWNAVCLSVQAALAQAGIAAETVAAIGFDATCSLVARGVSGEQISVSTTGDDRFDTIVWLDHRAVAEADALTASGHRVLGFSGGSISPEMQMPKLMWLKTHLPQAWSKAGHFFDLADFLTWKASGATARSNCTLTAKWNFLAHQQPGWQQDYLELAGIGDLLSTGGLPGTAVLPGDAVGHLTATAASQLGLDTGCLVAAGLIDAYAGALGALAGSLGSSVAEHAALIAGTSSCVVVLTPQKFHGHSLWGPYWNTLIGDHWLLEGGQSATGALLDHIVRSHPAGGEPSTALHLQIAERVDVLRAIHGQTFADRLHVLPDFHGNRSPFADPYARGVISGLTLDISFDSLCALYWRTSVAIALGTRHVLDAMDALGHRTTTLHVAGGHIHNSLLMELYADVTGRRVVVPKSSDAVLLGTAMTAASAARLYPDLSAACCAMNQGQEERTTDRDRRPGYERDYKRFLAMHRHRAELDAM